MLNFFGGNIFTVCGLIDKSSVDSDSFERQHWTSRLIRRTTIYKTMHKMSNKPKSQCTELVMTKSEKMRVFEM